LAAQCAASLFAFASLPTHLCPRDEARRNLLLHNTDALPAARLARVNVALVASAAPVAAGADDAALVLDGDCAALVHVRQVHLEIVLLARPARHALWPAEAMSAEEVPEDVHRVVVPAAAARLLLVPLHAVLAVAVVDLALLGVREHLVGVRKLHKLWWYV